MAKLTITTGNPRIDGVYEIDLAAGFTKQEHYLMKKQVGVVIADLLPGAPIDMNVLTAFGLVVLDRAGKTAMFELYMQTTDAQTEWEFDEGETGDIEDESVPLKTGSGDATSESESTAFSGPTTNGSSEHSPETTHVVIGSQPSDTTATFDLEISETSRPPS